MESIKLQEFTKHRKNVFFNTYPQTLNPEL